MKTPLAPLAALCLALPAAAQVAPPAPARTPRAIADQVSEENLRATVQRLVGFGTRHTLSVRDNPGRGIGAALNWAEGEFRRIGRGCGNCLEIVRPADTVTNARIPTPSLVEDVVAIQRGTSDPDRVIVITGHIDSRVTDVMNATADAPGANDDGSGTAAVLEAARILSHFRFPATIVYGVVSGEEQGLNGSTILAAYARDHHWQIEADLNNDIIGNSCGSDGMCDAAHVRVFSEGPRWQGREELARAQRALGGENDSPSRNLSRFIDTLADQLDLGLDVRQVWRTDRYGRGGDHEPFLDLGYPAVRFTVAVENYNWQHQDLRTENGVVYGDTSDHMDFPYLRRVTQLNVATIAALALAPAPPAPTIEGAVSTNTTISWPLVRGATNYRVRWRRTDSAQWEQSAPSGICVFTPRIPAPNLGDASRPNDSRRPPQSPMEPNSCRTVLPHVRVDDWVFGVSSVAADGSESPVASAVPGGAFAPYVAPPPRRPQ